jgi:hypothetical protein
MRTKVGVVIAALALGLAACGGDDDDSASGADYCELATQAEAASDALDQLDGSDAAANEAAFAKIVDSIAAAADAAPGEIRSDVETTLEGFRELVKVFEANDWDLTAATEDPKFTEVADTQKYQDAGNAVEAFNEQECGIPSDG